MKESQFSYLMCSLLCMMMMMDGWQTSDGDENTSWVSICFCQWLRVCVREWKSECSPADAEQPWYLLVTCCWLVNNLTIHQRAANEAAGCVERRRIPGIVGKEAQPSLLRQGRDERNVILVYCGLILSVSSPSRSRAHTGTHTHAHTFFPYQYVYVCTAVCSGMIFVPLFWHLGVKAVTQTGGSTLKLHYRLWLELLALLQSGG